MQTGSAAMPENQFNLGSIGASGIPAHVHLNFTSSAPPSVFFNYGAYNDYRNTCKAGVGPYSRPNNGTVTESQPREAEGQTEGITLQVLNILSICLYVHIYIYVYIIAPFTTAQVMASEMTILFRKCRATQPSFMPQMQALEIGQARCSAKSRETTR